MPTSLWILAPIILAVGAGIATQNVVNTALSRYASALGAAFFSVTGTFLVLLVLVLLNAGGSRTMVGNALHAPAYLWIGGIFGVLVLTSAVLLIPRVGAATFIAFLVAGQLIGALVLDQLGAFGLPRFPATWVRVLGVALLIGGARLVLWR
jgi:transporter family-2 protein